MIVNFDLPKGTDTTLLLEHYPDIQYYDSSEEDDQYFIGSEDPLELGDEWLTLEEAEQFYGFILGLVPNSAVWFEGWGVWGMGQEQKEPEFKKGYLIGQSAAKQVAAKKEVGV